MGQGREIQPGGDTSAVEQDDGNPPEHCLEAPVLIYLIVSPAKCPTAYSLEAPSTEARPSPRHGLAGLLARNAPTALYGCPRPRGGLAAGAFWLEPMHALGPNPGPIAPSWLALSVKMYRFVRSMHADPLKTQSCTNSTGSEDRAQPLPSWSSLERWILAKGLFSVVRSWDGSLARKETTLVAGVLLCPLSSDSTPPRSTPAAGNCVSSFCENQERVWGLIGLLEGT